MSVYYYQPPSHTYSYTHTLYTRIIHTYTLFIPPRHIFEWYTYPSFQDTYSIFQDTYPSFQDTYPSFQDTYSGFQDTTPHQDTYPVFQDTYPSFQDTYPIFQDTDPSTYSGFQDTTYSSIYMSLLHSFALGSQNLSTRRCLKKCLMNFESGSMKTPTWKKTNYWWSGRWLQKIQKKRRCYKKRDHT